MTPKDGVLWPVGCFKTVSKHALSASLLVRLPTDALLNIKSTLKSSVLVSNNKALFLFFLTKKETRKSRAVIKSYDFA